MKRVVRSGTLFGYLKAACEVGIDGEAMLSRVGLSKDFADHPDSLIPLDAFVRLLDLSATESGRNDFGSRVAVARGVPDYGLVSLLLREEETLGDALRTHAAHLHHHCDGMYVGLDTRFGNPFLSFRIFSDYPTTQVMEFAACGLVQLIRWLVGSDWNPAAVCHEHSRQTHAITQSAFFRCETRYDQVISGILLGRDALSLKVTASPAVLRRQAKTLIEQTLMSAPDHFEVRVAQIMSQQLHDSNCNADTLAEILGMNRRTLHRRLASQGLSYSALLQQVRSDAAKRMIELNSIPLAEVAEAVGFGSLSSFSRWFQSSFGCSASEWKRKHRLAVQ
ncbi:AraC-like DNA-binding protein [Paraburkholderia unamae]|uniref:AraC family transcriptional regulator n=1 Tax=Paraburkholderia unamae TaxID=219649 RepID=UPI000DC4DA69|nr:AraC family transcriptional regulator [Paraburkholderia unamae]RAR57525.1 AraC-like DNA-binding protein [Paraburkholderia unamae]